MIENEISSLRKTINLLNNDIDHQNNNNEFEIFTNSDDEIDKQEKKMNLEINKFRENVVIINAYLAGSESQNDFEDKIYELKENIKELIKQKTNLEQEIKENRNIEKEIEANCNDLVRCLNDTHNKEQKIQLLLQKKKNNKNYNQENNEDEIDSVNNQNNNQIIKMNDDEKVIYFNKLVTDESQNKFDISVHDFFELTQNIGSVDEDQFNYMIDYYKYKQSKGENDSQIIFINLEQIDAIQLKKLLNLNSFSIQYLSPKILNNICQRLLLYDPLLEEIGKMRFLNEKLAYSEEKQAKNQRDNYLKKSKKSFYLIYNTIYNRIDICEGTTRVESRLFAGYDIEKVFIPSTVIDIQDNAFYQCKNLTTVTLNCMNLKAIGKSAFSDCENLRTFIMPDTVKIIEDYTFKGCKKLENIEFSKSLVEIKEKAFSNCDSLTKIILPKTIQEIGYGAFKKCQNLKNSYNSRCSYCLSL